MKKILFILALCSFVFATNLHAEPQAMTIDDPENTLILQLKDGPVVIKLRPDLAPKHVARIKELAAQKFYDGLVFHRVIDGFMAQTGDPTGTGMSGSGQKIPAEFSKEPFKRGTVGAARSSDPNSADSQFFIMFADGSFLNGQYTVWGEVISGMEFVDKITRGEPPSNPDKIVSLRLASENQNKETSGKDKKESKSKE